MRPGNGSPIYLTLWIVIKRCWIGSRPSKRCGGSICSIDGVKDKRRRVSEVRRQPPLEIEAKVPLEGEIRHPRDSVACAPGCGKSGPASADPASAKRTPCSTSPTEDWRRPIPPSGSGTPVLRAGVPPDLQREESGALLPEVAGRDRDPRGGRRGPIPPSGSGPSVRSAC